GLVLASGAAQPVSIRDVQILPQQHARLPPNLLRQPVPIDGAVGEVRGAEGPAERAFEFVANVVGGFLVPAPQGIPQQLRQDVLQPLTTEDVFQLDGVRVLVLAYQSPNTNPPFGCHQTQQ